MGSYWPDLSRYVNNGRIYGAQLREGAMYCDSINAYVEIPHNEVLNITGDMTLSFWVYLIEYPSDFAGLISKRKAEITTPWGSQVDKYGKVFFNFYTTEWIDFYSNTPLVLKKWYFITLRRDGQLAQIILNTEIDASMDFSDTPQGNSQPVCIGFDPRMQDNYVHAFFGDILLHNIALSLEQIRILYELTSPYGTR